MEVTADFINSKVVSGENGVDEASEVFKERSFRDVLVTLKSKMEPIKDEQKMKTTVVKVRPLEGDMLVKECRALINVIAKYMAE